MFDRILITPLYQMMKVTKKIEWEKNEVALRVANIEHFMI